MQYDLWSDGYGESVHLLDDNDEYPVAGYENLLNKVYNIVRSSDAKVLLDAGFGTGILTKKLYEDGYEIYGIDSSEQMVEAGQECMPNAHLKTADYSMGLPLSFTYKTYDMIISTYAFHHLDRYEKVNLMKDMLRQVKDGGKVVIGDLGFETAEEMKQFRKANKGKWLYEDLYMIYDEAIKDFDNIVWEKVSKCAGILTITK
jgi:putative AdoMet-dependent methyltransferase